MAIARRRSRGSWPLLLGAWLTLAVSGCAPAMNGDVTAQPSTPWAEAQLDVYLRLSRDHLASGDLARARAALAATERVRPSRGRRPLAEFGEE